MAAEVQVDTYGSDDGSVKIALRELSPYIRKGILAEAAFAAWQQQRVITNPLEQMRKATA